MRWTRPPTGSAALPRIELAASPRCLSRCPVCGFAELHFDEVAHRGALELAECPRCEHRATRPLPSRMQPAAARAPVDGETVVAA